MRISEAFDILQEGVGLMYQVDAYRATAMTYAIKSISEHLRLITEENQDLQKVLSDDVADIGVGNLK